VLRLVMEEVSFLVTRPTRLPTAEARLHATNPKDWPQSGPAQHAGAPERCSGTSGIFWSGRCGWRKANTDGATPHRSRGMATSIDFLRGFDGSMSTWPQRRH